MTEYVDREAAAKVCDSYGVGDASDAAARIRALEPDPMLALRLAVADAAEVYFNRMAPANIDPLIRAIDALRKAREEVKG